MRSRSLTGRAENSPMTLPTFVVIGAMKAGTVSRCHYLDGRTAAEDQRSFEQLLGHWVPSDWKWFRS